MASCSVTEEEFDSSTVILWKYILSMFEISGFVRKILSAWLGALLYFDKVSFQCFSFPFHCVIRNSNFHVDFTSFDDTHAISMADLFGL